MVGGPPFICVIGKSRYTTRLVTPPNTTQLYSEANSSSPMEAFNSRLESFAKARRVKQSNTKRTVSLKWPHPTHFLATPDTLTEAGFFFNPSWDAQDNVECFFCGKCLDGWEEQDDPFAIHWDKCRDSCAWAVVRCGLIEDVDRKGKCVFPFPCCFGAQSDCCLIVLPSRIQVDTQTESQWRRLGWRPSGSMIPGRMIESKATVPTRPRHVLPQSCL